MPKYKVHRYEVFRIGIGEIEADSMEDAIKQSEDLCDFDYPQRNNDFEYAEETAYFLVDPYDKNGELDYNNSKWFNGAFEIEKYYY